MVMAEAPRLSLLLLFISLTVPVPSSGLTTDGLSLLALKSAISSDPGQSLSSWSGSDSDPCGWTGVACRLGRVVTVSLSGLGLTGYIPSELALLSSLQNLSLSHNNLSGSIPSQIGSLTGLLSLDLSVNVISGVIPAELGALQKLVHLDLSSNYLSGSLPPSIGNLQNLAGVLNLSFNGLSGGIPAAYGGLPVDVSLDLQQNNLSGGIPQTGSLLNQGPTAFAGNPFLCGFPLKNPCQVFDESAQIPVQNATFTTSSGVEEEKKGLSPVAVALLVGVAVAAVAAVVLLHWLCRWLRRGGGEEKAVKEKKLEEKREGQSGELFVPVDEGFGLELEELLRASAYVVGKSRTGIVYKVVVGRGSAVAVRRLSEGDDGMAGGDSSGRRRREFEAEVATISRVKHANVVGLRAYYYAPDEKLLVYDYISNGSLYAALHGGSVNPPLPWSARLKIVQGAARGLAFIHECSPRRYVHGNIKSSKILLDEELNAYISGFGLSRLTSSQPRKLSSSSAHFATAVFGPRLPGSPSASYLAPEARSTGAGASGMTQKCDVYAFGVVLMEALTGRLPGAAAELEGEELEGFVRWAFREERALSEIVDPALLREVHAKKQVLAVFHVALGCTEPDPDSRLRMRAVSQSLDRLGGPS